MIDVHTHTLPGIDDGSKSVEESVSMLTSLARQGVTMVAATPHYYATQYAPEEFLARREKAARHLRSALTGEEPPVILGAEVLFFEGISQTERLPDLRIGDTPLLLLEMPFGPWSDRWVREILAVNEREGITVLLAHVDRYLHFTTPAVLEALCAHADAFLRFGTRRRMLPMLGEGMIHFLGSDCHNLTTRPPDMADAVAMIRKKLGPDMIAHLETMERRYFSDCGGVA